MRSFVWTFLPSDFASAEGGEIPSKAVEQCTARRRLCLSSGAVAAAGGGKRSVLLSVCSARVVVWSRWGGMGVGRSSLKKDAIRFGEIGPLSGEASRAASAAREEASASAARVRLLLRELQSSRSLLAAQHKRLSRRSHAQAMHNQISPKTTTLSTYPEPEPELEPEPLALPLALTQPTTNTNPYTNINPNPNANPSPEPEPRIPNPNPNPSPIPDPKP